jgi:hypothetical protein
LKAAACILAIVSLAGSLTPVVAGAGQPPSPTPSPAPSESAAAGPSNPCGSILSRVARPTVTTSVCTVETGHVLGTIATGYSDINVGAKYVLGYNRTGSLGGQRLRDDSNRQLQLE